MTQTSLSVNTESKHRPVYVHSGSPERSPVHLPPMSFTALAFTPGPHHRSWIGCTSEHHALSYQESDEDAQCSTLIPVPANRLMGLGLLDRIVVRWLSSMSAHWTECSAYRRTTIVPMPDSPAVILFSQITPSAYSNLTR